jgi:hypothetical protein
VTVSGTAYIDYDAYKSALRDLARDGVADPIVLPFAARPGQVVNIGGQEYRVTSVVSGNGNGNGGDQAGDTIVGYKVTKL